MLNPSLSFWVHCIDAIIFPIVGSSGALCWLSLLWAHCTGVCNLPHVGLTGECKLPLSWSFWPAFFGVLYLFIPWTYKPDNDYLNIYISPSVVRVINRQNIILKYGMRGHFRYMVVCFGWTDCLKRMACLYSFALYSLLMKWNTALLAFEDKKVDGLN